MVVSRSLSDSDAKLKPNNRHLRMPFLLQRGNGQPRGSTSFFLCSNRADMALFDQHLTGLVKSSPLHGFNKMIDRPNAAVTFVIVSSTPSASIMFLASISSGLRIALWSFSAGAGAWFGKRKLLYSLHFDKGDRGRMLRSSSSGASYENSKDSQLCKSLGIQSNQKTK